IMIDAFANEVDFLSIGTNDLIQYTLAVDRDNKEVAELYNAADPALRCLIETAIKAANAAEAEVNVCGQMSSSTTYTMLLLGLGLRRFSVTPSSLHEIKRVVRSVSVEQCQALAERVRSMENARNIRSFLKEELRKTQPEAAV